MATSATSRQQTERPWRQRSELYAHESEIRRLRAEGYSLRQIVDRLDLRLSRSTLHRWLRRADVAAGASPAGAPIPAATGAGGVEADSAEAAAEDAAAEALLAATDFTPPISSSRK